MFRRVGPGGRERGQASTAYLGAILMVAVLVGSVSAAAVAQQSDVTEAMKCAVLKLVTAGHRTCEPSGGGSPGGEEGGGHGGGPGGGGRRPHDCKDVVYADSTSGEGDPALGGYGRQLQVNCVWYPVPQPCTELMNIPEWKPGLTPPGGNSGTDSR